MASKDDPYHIYPVDDEREHILSGNCWCKPAFNKDRVMVHHSMDGREFDEILLALN